jgi:hypothetical protein
MLHGRKLTEKFAGSQGRQYYLIGVFPAFEHFHASRNHNEERGSHAALDHNSLAGLVVLYASGLRHPFDVVCAQILEERCLFEQFCFIHFASSTVPIRQMGARIQHIRGLCQRLSSLKRWRSGSVPVSPPLGSPAADRAAETLAEPPSTGGHGRYIRFSAMATGETQPDVEMPCLPVKKTT